MNALGINQGTSGSISVRHEGRMACLRGHHGMIAVGPSRAFWLAVEVETLARQYHGCLQIGKPPLPSKEIEHVRGKMAGYGHADG
jgi:L-fuculose-phosphate aldolase